MAAVGQLISIMVFGFGALLLADFISWSLALFIRGQFSFSNPFRKGGGHSGDWPSANAGASELDLGAWPQAAAETPFDGND